tara:strand:+ start:81 stop:671 length:591 start_codon:yes stop_codon:yes gene_type:complete
MKKKQQRIQIILISIGIFLILGTYFYYPNINKIEINENMSVQKSIDEPLDDEQSTTFENMEYEGLYDLDKAFTVKSENAYILNEDPDIVYMTQMHVILYLAEGRIVNITSDKGSYNKITYDCFFEKNVKVNDGETKIFAENLELLATKNTVEIYNDVNLIYPTVSLKADKMDYDFNTKYFKVSMFGSNAVKMKVVK